MTCTFVTCIMFMYNIITLFDVKGTLLVIADHIVGTIADLIQESAELEAGGRTE